MLERPILKTDDEPAINLRTNQTPKRTNVRNCDLIVHLLVMWITWFKHPKADRRI